METKNNFNFKEFIQDSRDVLVNPKEFFTRINLAGGIGQPLIKALIYGAVAGFFSMLWSFVHIGGALGGMFGGAAGIGAFFFAILGALIGSFIMGVIVLVLSSICGGNSDYEASFRVGVAIMVIYPISAFLGFLGGINYWLGTLIGVAVNLYALYLLYFGLTKGLKGKEQSAKITGYVLGAIMLLFVIIGASTRQAVKSFSKYGSKDVENVLKDLQKAAKEIEEETANYKDELEKETAKYQDKLEGLEEDFEDIQDSEEDIDDED